MPAIERLKTFSEPDALQARINRIMDIRCFAGSFERVDLGSRGTRWKSTDSIYVLGFGDIHFKLLKADCGIPSLQKSVGRNELHT